MRAWIAFGWAPWAMARATAVWRRSWKRTLSRPPLAFAGFHWLELKLDVSPELVHQEGRQPDATASRFRLRRLP